MVFRWGTSSIHVDNRRPLGWVIPAVVSGDEAYVFHCHEAAAYVCFSTPWIAFLRPARFFYVLTPEQLLGLKKSLQDRYRYSLSQVLYATGNLQFLSSVTWLLFPVSKDGRLSRGHLLRACYLDFFAREGTVDSPQARFPANRAFMWPRVL